MVHDPEKQDPEAIQHEPRGLDGEHEREDVERDDESKKAGAESDSIHSHSSSGTIEDNQERPQPAERSKSRSSSTRSRTLVVVPRSERRGLLARLTFVAEVERPYDYKRSTKWFITLLVALGAVAAPLGSSILMPALPDLAKDLDTSQTITNLSVALYMLSMSIFPLWWSSFSETLGRRTIFMVSFASFTVWNIAAALSTSMTMLIIMRVLSGGSAASVQAVGAGTIADIFEVRERGRAMNIFYLGPLLGPLLAPIIGGALSQAWGWRSTQWFQVIYGVVLFMVLTLFFPETLARKPDPMPAAVELATVPSENGKEAARPGLTRITTTQSMKVKTKRFTAILKRCFVDPLAVLLNLRFPAVAITVYLASITFGVLYVLNISIQQTFSEPPYSFSVIIIGLLYIPNSLGYVLGSLIGGRWADSIMHREAIRLDRYDSHHKLIFRPEDRMRENAWLASLLYPCGLIWYGWTSQHGLLWIVPMLANFFFGFGSMIVFGLSTTMLTEFMPKRKSSGVAINNFVRNIFSCVGGVVAQPLIKAIGNGWLFTGLGVICLGSCMAVVWAMKRFGPRWRLVMDEKLRS